MTTVKKPPRQPKLPPLSPWAKLANDPWRNHLPKMYQELVESGELVTALEEAAEAAKDLFMNLTDQGMNPIQPGKSRWPNRYFWKQRRTRARG